MTTTLACIGAGFADTTHGAQQTFRVLLDAMSSPGRIHALPAQAIDGLVSADGDLVPPFGIGMAASLLALLDADTPALLAGRLAHEGAAAYLRFHTGARTTNETGDATVAVAHAVELSPDLWTLLAQGSDEAPQDGATLMIEVDAFAGEAFAAAVGLRLRGPGIESSQTLWVTGLPDAFWRWRIALQAAMPRGVDIILTQGPSVVAIPRSSRIDRIDRNESEA